MYPSPEEIRDRALEDIEAFLKKTNMSPTAFGRYACEDWNMVFDLRKGRVPGHNRLRDIYAFIEEYEEKRRRVRELGTVRDLESA